MDDVVYYSSPLLPNTSKMETVLIPALDSIGVWQLLAEFLLQGCPSLKGAALPKVFSSLHGCRVHLFSIHFSINRSSPNRRQK